MAKSKQVKKAPAKKPVAKALPMPKPTATLVHMDPRKLVMNDQVRTESDEKADKELLESVRVHGVRVPIIARMVGKEVHVVAGHRRTVAALGAERPTVPVYLDTVTDDELPAVQLIENLQRSDMTLQDTADGVWKLYNHTADGSAKIVAEILGKSKAWVSKLLLLSAPGKASAVARKLMAADKLHDIEVAYMICQVEELSRVAADEIAANIENETRATIQKKLKALQGKAPADTGGDSEGDPEAGAATEVDAGPFFSVEVLTFMQRIITDATVQSSDTANKVAALAAIREALDHVE